MAKYKDPVLKQILDDLAVQNPDAPAIAVGRVSLSNVVASTAGGALTNTRATLTVAPDVGDQLAGTMTVYYRRLDLAELFGEGATSATFTGTAEQSVTLEQVMTKLSSDFGLYVTPELNNAASFDLTRTDLPIVLTPKADSAVLAPTPLAITVKTVPVDIGLFSQVTGINPFTSATDPSTGLPYTKPAPGEDIQAFIVKRLFLANLQTTPIPSSDYTFEVLPFVADSYMGNIKDVRITVTNSDGHYTGTQTFRYYLQSIGLVVEPLAVTTPQLNYTAGQNARQALKAQINANGVYAEESDFMDTELRPVRASDWTIGDTTVVFASEESLMYGSWYQPTNLKAVETKLYPYEEIVRFQVDVVGQKQIGTTTNLSTMPVTIELLEKPAAYGGTLAVTPGTLTTVDALPVGVYKIRITRPDSYRTPFTHRQFNDANPAELNIIEVFKLKGHDLSNTLAHSSITSVPAGCFDEAVDCYRAVGLLLDTRNLTTVPAGIFDKMTRCVNWNQAFNVSGITSFPSKLFGFNKVYRPSFSNTFSGCKVSTIPFDLFDNVRWLDLSGLFGTMTEMTTFPTGVLAAMNLRYLSSMDNMFLQCFKLTTVPADLFEGVPDPAPWALPSTYATIFSINNMFYNCSALALLPANLLARFRRARMGDRCTVDMRTMFKGCTALAAVPVGLLDGLTFITGAPSLSGTFSGCTSLRSLPNGFFSNCVLNGALGSSTSFTVEGCFFQSGLESIPVDLFTSNAGNLLGAQNTFAYTNIVSIPAGLFAGCSEIQTLEGCFWHCTQLTGVPAGLFADCSKNTTLESTFRQCSALASVPSNLLQGQTALESVAYMFWDATSLTAIPAGFFANMQALLSASGVFYSSGLTGPIDNVFTQSPLLASVDSAFAYTNITSAGPNVFSGAFALTNVSSVFSSCKFLTTVSAALLQNNQEILSLQGMFFLCETLTAVPANVIQSCPKVTTVANMLYGCKALVAVDQSWFMNSPLITRFDGFLQNCTALTTIPTGLFYTLSQVQSASSLFKGCTGLTTVGDNLFANWTTCSQFSNCFEGCTSLSAVPANLFGAAASNAMSATMQYIFSGCTALTAVPDGMFFAFKNISDISFCFNQCPNITTVGRLISNTMSPKITIGGLFYQGGTGDLALADNLIASTIPVNIGAYGYQLPFTGHSNLSKNIDNLFGANCKFQIATYETKNYFANMQITGSGNNFITKHAVPTTSNGFFTGSTTLSDYATLPAWAKA